jgi:hypothetical protein
MTACGELPDRANRHSRAHVDAQALRYAGGRSLSSGGPLARPGGRGDDHRNQPPACCAMSCVDRLALKGAPPYAQPRAQGGALPGHLTGGAVAPPNPLPSTPSESPAGSSDIAPPRGRDRSFSVSAARSGGRRPTVIIEGSDISSRPGLRCARDARGKLWGTTNHQTCDKSQTCNLLNGRAPEVVRSGRALRHSDNGEICAKHFTIDWSLSSLGLRNWRHKPLSATTG